MGNRLDAIKSERRLSKERATRSFSYVNTSVAERLGITQFKSSPNDNFIFIAPGMDKETGMWGKKVYVHNKIGPDNLNFLCLRRMKNEPCPICEELTRLRAKDAADERLALLKPSLRFLMFVVDVRDTETEKKGLRWYDSPTTVYDGILGLSEDKRSGEVTDISDPENKLCVTFTRTGTRMTTKYKDFVTEKYQGGNIPKDWCSDIPSFDELLNFQDYKTIQDAFMGYDKDEGEDDDAGTGGRSRTRAESSSREVDREEQPDKDEITDRVRRRMEPETSSRKEEPVRPESTRRDPEPPAEGRRVRSHVDGPDDDPAPRRGRRGHDEPQDD